MAYIPHISLYCLITTNTSIILTIPATSNSTSDIDDTIISTLVEDRYSVLVVVIVIIEVHLMEE